MNINGNMPCLPKNYHWPHLELKDRLRSDSEEFYDTPIRRETVQRLFKLLRTLINKSSHPLPANGRT